MATTKVAGAPAKAYDVERVRADFPILTRRVYGKPLVYLDNAATSQKPRTVIDAMDRVYRETNANIHRGVYLMSEETTALYEDARAKIAAFVNAPEPAECVMVRNATEAMNIVAYSWARANLKQGDLIVGTILEHHSNLVPWQQFAKSVGARYEVVDIDDDYRLRRDQWEALLAKKPKLVALTHVSNGIGTINPVNALTRQAKAAGATVLVDGAQAVPHMSVDVQAIGCDFYAFSGHKMVGPTGSGALWGRRALLEAMPPFLYGGDMIRRVTLNDTDYNELPWKFEAGTSDYVAAIGLGAAVEYLQAVGIDAIHRHERELTTYALERFDELSGVRTFGTRDLSWRAGIVSFEVDGIHPHDLATIIDREGVSVRAGHHCNQPLMDRLGVPATTRASLYLYNTRSEIDALVAAVRKAQQVFA
jgi:cysteine desulfurase/selenocysteine lyase